MRVARRGRASLRALEAFHGHHEVGLVRAEPQHKLAISQAIIPASSILQHLHHTAYLPFRLPIAQPSTMKLALAWLAATLVSVANADTLYNLTSAFSDDCAVSSMIHPHCISTSIVE